MAAAASSIEMTIVSVGRDAGKLEPHTLLVGLSEAAATLEDDLAVPQEVKQSFNSRPSNSTPGQMCKRIENGTQGKNLCTYIHDTLFIRAQRWEQPDVRPCRCTQCGLLLSHVKEWGTPHLPYMGGPGNHYAK